MFLGKNLLDILLVIILLIFIILYYFKGLIHGAFSFLALIGGTILARKFYYQTAQSWKFWVRPATGKVLAFILLFILAYFVISIIGKLLKKIIKKIHLNWLDRLGGAFLGLLIGGIIICFLMTMLVIFLNPNDGLLKKSKIAPYILHLISKSDTLIKIIPPEISNNFDERAKQLKRAWEKHHFPIKEKIKNKKIFIIYQYP